MAVALLTTMSTRAESDGSKMEHDDANRMSVKIADRIIISASPNVRGTA